MIFITLDHYILLILLGYGIARLFENRAKAKAPRDPNTGVKIRERPTEQLLVLAGAGIIFLGYMLNSKQANFMSYLAHGVGTLLIFAGIVLDRRRGIKIDEHVESNLIKPSTHTVTGLSDPLDK